MYRVPNVSWRPVSSCGLDVAAGEGESGPSNSRAVSSRASGRPRSTEQEIFIYMRAARPEPFAIIIVVVVIGPVRGDAAEFVKSMACIVSHNLMGNV